jgi:ATP/maltotriose-dependent transcriptional regulator MalT
LTLVRGLRGYGKTTEVAVWLESQSPEEVTAVWVAASPVTDDALSFEERLRAALRAAGIVPEQLSGTSAPSGLDELGAALLTRPTDRKLVLVIDNFEYVREAGRTPPAFSSFCVLPGASSHRSAGGGDDAGQRHRAQGVLGRGR